MPDVQAAHEKTITNLLPALAGANLIYGMGMLESGVTWSHEQLIIDNDIVKMVKHAVQGIAVTDDTLATELVKRAYEIKDFLHQKHTVQHMREQSKPNLIDRATRGTWEDKGGTDMTQRAKEEVKRILTTHQVEPLSDDVKKTLSEIIRSVGSKRKERMP